MEDLRSQLEAWRGRRLWLLGVGNPERGDDGFGIRLARALMRAGVPRHDLQVVDVGTCPERYVGEAARAGCQDLVFADAVDLGAEPGALLLASGEELRSRPPGTATHRVPLAVLAQYAEGLGMRAWLLGVQPASLAPGEALSPPVAAALEVLVEVLAPALGMGASGADAAGELATSRARTRARARARGGEPGVDP